ncbi:MAG: putative bifunctional diguanylate cyclase/phosphodiesterase, partial [Acidimicrobiales bacterium]
LEALSHPITIDGLVLGVRASIGVSIAPLDGTDPSTLLKRADVAMYSAKATKRGVVSYNPQIDHHTTRRLVLATELRQAVEAGDLEVWYQPIAELESGHVHAFEALLRWRHPDLGPVSPDEFIPVAEQTGLIEPLTWWVLGESLRELRAWQAEGYQMGVSVNVSTRSLLDSEVVDRLRRTLDQNGVAPSSLTLELTESSIMVEPDRAEQILRRLADLDVRIAIDDFGTGYSSLSRLKRLPVQTVKIDRSFVRAMCTDEGDDAIVRTTIELARNMGHTVVAEGIEDPHTWRRLADLGCDQGQGYYLSPALPAVQCLGWLKRRQSPTLAVVRPIRDYARGA